MALLPISAFLAFRVALLLSAAFSPSFLGTDSSTAGIPDPVWLGPLTIVLAGAVFLLPALLAVGRGARASRHGRRGWIPAVTAVLLVAVVVWLIVLSVVLGP
ncbi:MAG: hypothetical protein H5T83_08970 [Actinotalea sp.]|nr:hypothetical protein [Actinotalea sp.]